MKDILKEISNPFDFENFKKLLQLYIKSGYMTTEGRYKFYASVVSYNNKHLNKNTLTETNDQIPIPEERFAKSPILSNKMYNSFWLETNYFSKPRRYKT